MSTMLFPSNRPSPVAEVLPAGLRPVGTGARTLARLLDGLLAVVALAGAAWLVWSLLVRGVLDTSGLIGGIFFVLWLVLALWALLARGARLAGLVLGQRWVLLPHGQRAGWAVFGKFAAQAGIAIITLGVGEAIISLTSIRPPLGRTWFDRITGLVLVAGRPAGAVPRPTPVDRADSVHQVRQVGLPEPRQAPWHAQPWPERPINHQAPSAARSVSARPPADPIADVGIHAVNDGFIASLPFGSTGERVAPPVPETDQPQRSMVVRDRAYAAADIAPGPAQAPPADHTVLAPHSGSAPTSWLRLDDGARIELDTSIVFGRDPLLPPDLRTGRTRALTDPSMELSKTHLAVGAGLDGVWVVDLDSTNGVRIAAPGAASRAIPSGKSIIVGIGHRIEFGGRSLEVCSD